MEFDTSEAARREAVNGARDMIADGLRAARRIDLRSALEVRNAAGELVHLITFEDALDAGFHQRLSDPGGSENAH